MGSFESVIIISPEIKENERAIIIKETQKFMKNVNTREMGIRRLAYTVKGNEKGYYVEFNYKGTSSQNKQLEEYYKNNTKIIKYIIIKVGEE